MAAHTADVILEAWGPDLPSCAEEAVAALVSTFASAGDSTPVARRAVHLHPAPAESLLLDLLEEVIFTLDTEEAVPVGVEIHLATDGGWDVVLRLADRSRIEPTGAVPKGVSRSELAVAVGSTGARCRVLVDV